MIEVLIEAAKCRIVMFQLFRQMNWLKNWTVGTEGLIVPRLEVGRVNRYKVKKHAYK
jgi:hypothetical protein